MSITTKLDNIRRLILNTAAEVNEFRENWGDEFAFKELKSCFMNKELSITLDELKSLDTNVLYSYGFGNWDNKLILIPLYLVNFIDPNSIVTSIMDNVTSLDECDKDVRFGCIAYGFYKE